MSTLLRISAPVRALTVAYVACSLLLVAALGAQDSTKAPQGKTQMISAADQTALQSALNAYDEGRPQEAEPALRELVHRYPDNFVATETLGLILADRSDFASALAVLERACRASPSSALGFANLGTVLLKMNRTDEAVSALKRSVALDPKNAETQSALGQALMQAGRPAEAASAFALGAKGKPGNADIVYNWALALFNAKQFKKAGEVLSRVPVEQSSAEAQSLLADIEEQQGHYEAAVAHFKTAATLNPSEGNLYALGLEFMRHWTFPAAIQVYEFALSKYPTSSRLRLGMGVAAYGNSDYARAVPIFAGLLAGSADNALYADLLGRSCLSLSQEQSCDSLQAFALQHHENATAATFAAANILRRPEKEQDRTLARRLLEQAISANPELPEAYFQMGVLDQQEMEWQDSAKVLEKAVALRPEYGQAHYRLARAYQRLGRNEEAQREIALSQKYNEQEKENLNTRLQAITTFLVTLK